MARCSASPGYSMSSVTVFPRVSQRAPKVVRLTVADTVGCVMLNCLAIAACVIVPDTFNARI